MLKMVLVLQSHVQSLYTRWESFPRVEIQIGQADLVTVSRSFRLENVEINGVVIGQTH